MATNDLLLFGTAVGANVLTQAEYAALAARLPGFAAGIARSPEVNKALRQAAFAAAMLGEFTADYSGDNVVDDGDVDKFEASFLKALQLLFPRIATGSVTLWVRSDGNDTTGDGSANTAAKAFLTVARAIQYAQQRISIVGFQLIVRLGTPATYTPPGAVSGISDVLIQGDAGNIANYIISGAVPGGGGSYFNALGSRVRVTGVTVNNSTTTAQWFSVSGGGQMTVDNMVVTGAFGSSQAVLAAGAAGTLTLGAGLTFSNIQCGAVLSCDGGRITQTNNIIVSGTNTCSSAFAVSLNCGVFTVFPSTGFVPSGTTTGQRYIVSLNGVVNVNGAGANYFPGTIAGSAATGGQYV